MIFVNEKFEIRQADMNDMKKMLEWAGSEGWNPGLNDDVPFFACDPKGFFVGELGGETISGISAVSYGEAYGFIGFYIVVPGHRGKGFGYATWKYGMERLKTKNIGLDGVVAQQENYRKSGFVFRHRNIRFRGLSEKSHTSACNIVETGCINLDELVKYDSAIFGAERYGFLKEWVNMKDSKSFFCTENGSVKGYISIRRCFNGYKIGPLFADSREIAESLMKTSLNCIPENSEYFFDMPDINTHKDFFVRKYSLTPVFETARMYTGDHPVMDVSRCFGVTTFELG